MKRNQPKTLREKTFCKYRQKCFSKLRWVGLDTLIRRPNLIPSSPGVYIIVRKQDLYPYVGESINVSQRLIQHGTVNYPTQYVDREIRKSGTNAFKVTFIEETSRNTKQRRQREKKYVKLFNSYYNGFNGSVDGHPKNKFQRTMKKFSKKFVSRFFPQFYKKRRRHNRFKGTIKLMLFYYLNI